MRIILANPRGFCAGVDRAIQIVERALAWFGTPLYVRHEVVHNKTVVEALRQKGVIFIEDLQEVPCGATLIFSAHGVSQAVRALAQQRQLRVFDATCPLVTKVHMEVARYSRLGQECILIGHRCHPEVEGTLGHYDNPKGGIYLIETREDVDRLTVKHPQQLGYVTQTTLSVDDTQAIITALQQRFPSIVAPKKEDICYATQNRQQAVKELAMQCDLVLVLGSQNSSNSNRLKEVVDRLGKKSYLIDSFQDVQPQWLTPNAVIGITAGASAPELLVQALVNYLQSLTDTPCEVLELSGTSEDITFSLPRELKDNRHPQSTTIDTV